MNDSPLLPQTSEQFDIVFKQLMLAKKQMGSVVKKDSDNSFHKSKYASLGAHLELCEETLDDHGLILFQAGNAIGDKPFLVATICHPESGQWLKSYFPLPNPKNDSQGLGGAITYMRRYSINAMLGLSAEDDDGETAAGRGSHADAKAEAKKEKEKAKEIKATHIDQVKVEELKGEPRMTAKQAEELYQLGDQCTPRLIERIKKFMSTHFNATSFEMCPMTCYEQFKNSMLQNIALQTKEKAI
jgi:hypothetical protein